MQSREEVLKYLKKKYPQGVLSGETENNLEEIIVDLFEREFLENHDKVRKELQDYRGDTLNDTHESIVIKSGRRVNSKKDELKSVDYNSQYESEERQ